MASSDQGWIVRNNGSVVVLRARLRVLFDEMRRLNRDIAALWEIYERAKERESAGL